MFRNRLRYSDVRWASRRLKSAGFLLFFQGFVAIIKENMNSVSLAVS